jgi:hypothetical protein
MSCNYINSLCMCGNRYSVVGVVTRLQLGETRVSGSSPERVKRFFSSPRIQILVGPTQTLSQGVPGAFSHG